MDRRKGALRPHRGFFSLLKLEAASVPFLGHPGLWVRVPNLCHWASFTEILPRRLTPDAIFRTCTLFYLTNTLGSGMLPYRDNPYFTSFLIDSKYYIKVPMAMSTFPEEIAIAPKRWVAATGNLQWYRGASCAVRSSRPWLMSLARAQRPKRADSKWKYKHFGLRTDATSHSFIALEFPDLFCEHLRDAFASIWPGSEA